MKTGKYTVVIFFICIKMSLATTADTFTERFDYGVGEKTDRPIIGTSIVICQLFWLSVISSLLLLLVILCR